MEQDRRKSTRYPLIAHIELLEESTATRLKARVSDISMEGCYLDMVNPLPSGTNVRITITSDESTLKARGRIIYSVQHMGAGVHFEEFAPGAAETLKKWVAEAEKNSPKF